jgi:hypothetical protein
MSQVHQLHEHSPVVLEYQKQRAQEFSLRIGDVVDVHYNQVAVWRRRYGEFGLAGLGAEDRPGPAVCLRPRRRVVGQDGDRTAAGRGDAVDDGSPRRGDEPLRGGDLDVAGRRICRALDPKPWQVQSWMTITTPTSGRRPATCAART